uniref:Uncharacterized protein n=1 Tax=Anopheles maculatus TaxID=74869 RepID=A0A182SKZ5_9DIPT
MQIEAIESAYLMACIKEFQELRNPLRITPQWLRTKSSTVAYRKTITAVVSVCAGVVEWRVTQTTDHVNHLSRSNRAIGKRTPIDSTATHRVVPSQAGTVVLTSNVQVREGPARWISAVHGLRCTNGAPYEPDGRDGAPYEPDGADGAPYEPDGTDGAPYEPDGTEADEVCRN